MRKLKLGPMAVAVCASLNPQRVSISIGSMSEKPIFEEFWYPEEVTPLTEELLFH